jgi:hypothetical protein
MAVIRSPFREAQGCIPYRRLTVSVSLGVNIYASPKYKHVVQLLSSVLYASKNIARNQ